MSCKAEEKGEGREGGKKEVRKIGMKEGMKEGKDIEEMVISASILMYKSAFFLVWHSWRCGGEERRGGG